MQIKHLSILLLLLTLAVLGRLLRSRAVQPRGVTYTEPWYYTLSYPD